MKSVAILIGVLLIAGCTSNIDGGAPFESRVNSSNALDDGNMLVFKDYLSQGFGMVSGEGEDLLLGDFKAGNYSVVGRVLYRFNVSDFNGTAAVFHLLCTGVYGNPGPMEIYSVSDFGRLPLRPSQPLDVNSTWGLITSGFFVSQASTMSGEWFTFTIPSDNIQGDVLSLIIKLSNESLSDGNYYVLHSYERGESRNQQKPYLTYE